MHSSKFGVVDILFTQPINLQQPKAPFRSLFIFLSITVNYFVFLSIKKIAAHLHVQNKLKTRKDFKLNGCKPARVLTNFLYYRFSHDCDEIK